MYELSNIDIQVVERDGMVVVSLEGEVDLCAAPALEESLTRVAASQASSIVIDLDRVSFMDSAGVHVLLQFSLAHGNGTRLAFTPGSRQVQRLFEVTGVRSLPAVRAFPAPPHNLSSEPQRASSASFRVWLGRIAAATLSGSGR